MADNTIPMGGNLPEDSIGRAEVLISRNCWAIDTLVEEVVALFKTDVETSEPNQFNANLVVTFMPAVLEREDLYALLETVGEEDERIESVVIDDADETIALRINPNPILMDTRDSFNIDSAALGLDRELGPDDLTDLAAGISNDGEGFIEDGSL